MTSTTAAPAPKLPGITLPFLATMACMAALAGVGIYSYAQQEMHGEIVTGLRTVGSGGVGWGLYIVFVVFFMGLSFAGINVAALTRLLDIAALRPIARIAELLTIVALLLGASCVLADLGRPDLGLLNLPRYARPNSPFFGTFSMVLGGYLFSSLVFFYLAGRADAATCAKQGGPLRFFHRLWAMGYRDTPGEKLRHRRVTFWMSLTILPLLVVATSTLGFIFGIQAGRPGWYSALQAPAFVALAATSGVGMLIVVAAVLRWSMDLQRSITQDTFKWLGNFLWVLVLAVLYFLVVEELTASYAASERDRHMAHVVVSGPYARFFWVMVGSLLLSLAIGLTQFLRKHMSIPMAVLAGLLANVGAVLKRYILVTASQTHGNMLPWMDGSYSPTWVELGFVCGLFGLGGLIIGVFTRLLPLVPISEDEPGLSNPMEERRRGVGRLVLTAMNLVVGLSMAVVGFMASARMWTHAASDPVIPFAPILFVAGVMLTFFTGGVYELIPEGARAARPHGD